MGLKLDRRQVSLGVVNPRIQKHGNQNVTALDIPLLKITLSSDELGVVMLNPKADRLLFIHKKGRPEEPAFGKVSKIIPFDHKIIGVSGKLFLGRRLLTVTDGTLNRCRLELGPGVRWWHVQLQCVPDLDENHPLMEALMARMGEEIDIELECEHYGAQPELPLEEEEEWQPPDTDDKDDDEDEPLGFGVRRPRSRGERSDAS